VLGFYNPLTQHDSNRLECLLNLSCSVALIDKNKYNIILSIGEDKVTKDAAQALFEKHPNTSIIATLDEQGKLILPQGEAFTPD
jgi:hypothetical protein